MNNLDINKILFENSDLDTETISNITKKSLYGFEDGELFIEYCESESMVLDDSKIKNASFFYKKRVWSQGNIWRKHRIRTFDRNK